MARGALSENERLDVNVKTQTELNTNGKSNSDTIKSNCLRVRFLDEEGKTERLVSTDEVDCSAVHVKKIHFQKNRSSSETSILLRNPSLIKRRTSNVDYSNNNNTSSENLNGKISILKFTEIDTEKTEAVEHTKEPNNHYKRNCNVYSVNQAKTLSEKKRTMPLTIPKILNHKGGEAKSFLPAEVCLAEAPFAKDFTARTIGKLSRGLGRLLRRTNSVRISEPDPVYKVAYLGNVLTGWARGENCIEKPLATLWRNYQQSTKPDVVMKLSVTNSGLKGFTKEHGLTEYWSHRVTYCASPPHYPKLFCWVYRHEGKKLKHELRCHAVLCTKEVVSKKITEELQVKLKQALAEFKKDRISKQNARLSLANSVYDNPSMPQRKILKSVGALNYRPPLERSKSAPKLGAIEELCSEEDEEEAEMTTDKDMMTQSSEELNRLCSKLSPRKTSCPDGFAGRERSESESSVVADDLISLIVEEFNKKIEHEASHVEFHKLESIDESIENIERNDKNHQNNYLITDSDDGSVSSGCESGSALNSDTEPSSLPSQYPFEEIKESRNNSAENNNNENVTAISNSEVNHIPLGEKNFRRRSTYPPLRTESVLSNFDNKFESLIDNMGEYDSIKSNEEDVFKNVGDNESACSDESGYSELVEGKESVIGNTIMV